MSLYITLQKYMCKNCTTQSTKRALTKENVIIVDKLVLSQ